MQVVSMSYGTLMKPALEILLSEIGRVQTEANALREQAAKQQDNAENLAAHGRQLAIDPTLDDEGIGTMAIWEAKDEAWAAQELETTADGLEQQSLLRRDAEAALATSVLQIVKQGISTLHGGLAACPAGRTVDGLSLKDIIWQARNQAMHYEEGNLHQPVLDLFHNLEQCGHAQFADPNGRNFAIDVLAYLGWTHGESIDPDLVALGLQ
jgi:hypothetical protein